MEGMEIHEVFSWTLLVTASTVRAEIPMGRASSPFLVARQREHGPLVWPVTDARNLPREQAGKKMNVRNTLRVVAFVAAVQFSLCTTQIVAAMLSPGDILVTDVGSDFGTGPGGIFKVDPSTGDRTVISGFGVGSGPDFSTPFGITVTLDGDILVTDISDDSIFRVDPTTGDRTRVSGPGVGSGPAFGGPAGIALGPGNSLIVTTEAPHEFMGFNIGDVYRVDLTTGDRTTLSSSFLGIGTGPDLFRPVSVVISANGQSLVTDFERILKIDPLTGNRSLLSGDQVGTGPDFGTPAGIALEGNGDLLVADFDLDAIFRVDPTTGDRVFASGGGIGSGPELQSPLGVAVNADGTIFATDQETNALYSINPITGDRILFSGTGVGLGPDFTTPFFITVVPVPEPSTAFLCITGMALLILARRRKNITGRC